MRLTRAILISSTLVVAIAHGLMSCPCACAAEKQSFQLSTGDTLTVVGETFTYESVSTVVNESVVMQDIATWDGDVTAQFSGIEMRTGHIEAAFSGAEVSRLFAGPQVHVTGFDNRASFDCAEVAIDFPTIQNGLLTYTGHCDDVRGSILIRADELGLEGSHEYRVNFTAKSTILEPDHAVLKLPRLSFGNLDHPDIAIGSREIDIQLKTDPATHNWTLVGASVPNGSVTAMGRTIHLLQFPYYRGFVKKPGPGLSFGLPRAGWISNEGPFIDESVYYNLYLGAFSYGPEARFRLNTFPLGRTYPEVDVDAEMNMIHFNLRAGYRREEDPSRNPVPTRAEPDFAVRLKRTPIGNTRLGFRAAAFAGRLRDMSYDVVRNRWGYETTLDYPAPKHGHWKLSGQVDFRNLYYEGSQNYRVLESLVRLRYADPPDWGTTLSYRRADHWGTTPFRWDIPQVSDELSLREQTRLTDRWGAGFDWAWDFDKGDFRRRELHGTYIFDSFQMSVGWDFTGNSLRIQMALPGDLK